MNNLSIKKINEKLKKKKKGFTLVELIIVIAIIAILAAIAIPKFGQVTKKSNITADIATAKNLSGIAAQAVSENQALLNSDTSDSATKSAILAKLDGGVMPTTKTTKQAFAIAISANGDITVTANGEAVYPTQGSDFTIS